MPFSTFLGQVRVEFSPYQQSERCPVKPGHKRNESAQCSIGPVIVCEMTEINPQQVRKSNPARYSENRPRKRGEKPLLHIRTEKVHRFYRKYREADRNYPVHCGPE